ncbi:putative orphan protein [Alteromonadales bacterium TW-7]|nr:putative orphan protein [Alteromonadales bacterium TW-7]
MKKLIIAAAIIAAGVGGVSYANYVATQEVRAEVDKQLAMVSGQTGATFKYAGLSASVISKSVEITSMEVISPEGESVANVQSIEVKGYETDKISPHTSLDVKNLTLSKDFIATLPADTNAILASASYNLHSSLDYNEESGESYMVVKLNAQDVVSFNMDLGLANSKPLMDTSLAMSKEQKQAGDTPLTYEQQLQQQTRMMQAMSKLEPRNANFVINNQGKLKELLESELSKQGMTIEQMQAMLAKQLEQAPVTEEIANALTSFASGLNSLTVSAKLPEGQTMMEVNQQLMMLAGKPEELVKFINLEVKGE